MGWKFTGCQFSGITVIEDLTLGNIQKVFPVLIYKYYGFPLAPPCFKLGTDTSSCHNEQKILFHSKVHSCVQIFPLKSHSNI